MFLEHDQMCQKDTDKEWGEEDRGKVPSIGHSRDQKGLFAVLNSFVGLCWPVDHGWAKGDVTLQSSFLPFPGRTSFETL